MSANVLHRLQTFAPGRCLRHGRPFDGISLRYHAVPTGRTRHVCTPRCIADDDWFVVEPPAKRQRPGALALAAVADNPATQNTPWQALSPQLCRQAVLARQSSNCRRRPALSSKWQQAMALKPTRSALLLPLQWRQQPWRVCYAGPRLSMLQQWRWQWGEWTKRRASPA